MDLTRDYLPELEPRLKRFLAVMLICVGCIMLRVYYLQGIKGNFYRLFSEENSIHEIPIPALRGVMLDRNNIPLVDNRQAFDLVITPQYVADPKPLFEILQKQLQIPAKFLETQWEKRRRQPAYQPIPILKDVSMDIVSWVKVHKSPWSQVRPNMDLRGVDIRMRYEREYPEKDMASHVLGYLREIDKGRLEKYRGRPAQRYQRGDQVGVNGLEEIWDLEMRGQDGSSQKVINAVGREVAYAGIEDELIQKEAKAGNHLKLTLDARLQKVARDFFKGKKGAAVALDPKDGAVLLMFSAPTFDLNLLGGEEGNAYWQKIVIHPDRYLLNRSIQGAYPPGSTYKIVAATAALQEGVVQPSHEFFCDGSFHFGNRDFHCWRKDGHGRVSFHRALVASCDVYFYNVGLKLGVDRLAKYANAFGLGEPTGIELSNERSGLIPTSAWKEDKYKSPWAEGETLSIAIGQGYNSVTPLQEAVMISVVANGGKRVKPYLVQSIVDPVTGEEKFIPREEVSKKEGEVVFSEGALAQVKDALAGVVSDPEGTAHRLSLLNIPMGGKTGTAQVISLGKGCRGGGCSDHAWFVAFAPVENPTIAVAVLVENGGHGSSAAAPLAGEIIKTYLEKEEHDKSEVLNSKL